MMANVLLTLYLLKDQLVLGLHSSEPSCDVIYTRVLQRCSSTLALPLGLALVFLPCHHAFPAPRLLLITRAVAHIVLRSVFSHLADVHPVTTNDGV